jgi:peptide/nickel transport system permease protein
MGRLQRFKREHEWQLREMLFTVRLLSRNPSAMVGFIVIVSMLLMALFAPLLAPYDPIHISLSERLSAPGFHHLFGTDELGRDILSRIMYGARISLRIGVLVIAIAGGLGTFIGALSGFFGRKVDNLIMRLMDIILSFPPLVLAMALAAALGPNLNNAIIAVAFVMIPKFARLVRGEALVVKEKPFIASARVTGASSLWIIAHHVMPNCLSSVIVLGTLVLGDTILVASSLSFIGLGAQPPSPEWGAMIAVGRKFLMDQWWYATFPGLFILTTVIGFNIFGDALRDILDPRIRR